MEPERQGEIDRAPGGRVENDAGLLDGPEALGLGAHGVGAARQGREGVVAAIVGVGRLAEAGLDVRGGDGALGDDGAGGVEDLAGDLAYICLRPGRGMQSKESTTAMDKDLWRDICVLLLR